MSSLAIPRGSLVLVTGVTGTIGSAVANEILSAGYKVRAPIRNADKGKLVSDIFDKRHGSGAFSTTLISNMADPGALDDAMKGCAGVVHVMTETSLSPDPNQVIPASQAFVNNVLSAAAKTPSVQRVVYTSSQAVLPALTESGLITNSSRRSDGTEITAKAWAEPHVPQKAPLVYLASKLAEEKACWDFVEREKPSFVFNTVIPGFCIGEVMHPKLISSSNGVVLGLLQSNPGAVGFLSSISPTNFVNVKDAALMHLAALTVDSVKSRRLLALGEEFDINRVVELLAKLAPGSNLPPRVENIPKPVAEIDTEFELGLLKGFGRDSFVGLDEAVTQCLTTSTTGSA